jgi:hypothetical protein
LTATSAGTWSTGKPVLVVTGDLLSERILVVGIGQHHLTLHVAPLQADSVGERLMAEGSCELCELGARKEGVGRLACGDGVDNEVEVSVQKPQDRELERFGMSPQTQDGVFANGLRGLLFCALRYEAVRWGGAKTPGSDSRLAA